MSTGPADLPQLAPVPRHARRLVYLGTPEAAVPPLAALVDAGFEILAVVTRVDKRRGRGGSLMPSPVKAAAVELGLPVVHRVDEALGIGAELGVVVAFGQLIRPHVLAALPMVNLHFSLLPRWRGAAPVERALLAGDRETGVCVMQVEHGLDTGGVFARAVVPIGERTTAAELRGELVGTGTRLLVEALSAGLGEPQPQVGEPVYASKIEPAELRIDWSRPAAELDRLVRLGGAWTTFRSKRMRIVAAEPALGEPVDGGAVPGTLSDGVVACGTGGLVLRAVQPEGKPAMPFESWAHGARPHTDERFDS
ncbi:MAG: methionyl-tRNA formyltransferase [Acidimicrobiia bacterium]